MLSLSARRAWIEIEFVSAFADHDIWSLSARRAWIEIVPPASLKQTLAVALRKESVDRNKIFAFNFDLAPVALRKESVDRNTRTGQRLEN